MSQSDYNELSFRLGSMGYDELADLCLADDIDPHTMTSDGMREAILFAECWEE